MKKGGKQEVSGDQKRAKTKAKSKAPYGRDEVKKAILDATEKLLLEKDPNRITVREIAETARIKHPLIHRHFGTKDDVVIAVHARGIARVERKIGRLKAVEGSVGTFFEAVKKNQFRQAVLSRAMLDGVPPRSILNGFPVMHKLLALIKKRCAESEKENEFTPEMLTAVLASAALGWFLYEPFLLAATGQDDQNPEDLQKTVARILEEIVAKLC